jgi:branched-subunit amino acid aminotransferase/4-amino-4-deoxychorismate lyase
MMSDLADLLSETIAVFSDRCTANEKHLMALYQSCSMMSSAMLEYKKAIIELQQQVKELRANAAEKIILEE